MGKSDLPDNRACACDPHRQLIPSETPDNFGSSSLFTSDSVVLVFSHLIMAFLFLLRD
jgi:hypothetical protein